MTDPAPDQEPVVAVAPQAPAQGNLNEPPVPQPAAREDMATSGEESQSIHATRGEQAAAFFKQAITQGPIGWMGEAIKEKDAHLYDQFASTPKLTPEEANKQYPGMPEAFSKPIDPGVAKLQFERFSKLQSIQNWAASGGPAPFTQFGVSLGAGFVDPVNIAVTLMTGGLSKAVGLGQGIKAVVAQNLLANTALGAAEYAAEKEGHLNPDFGGSVEGVLKSTLVGVGIHYSAAAIARAFKSGIDSVRNTPKDLVDQNVRTVMAQQEAGFKHDVSYGQAEATARARGDIEGQTSSLRFNPETSQGTLYAARDGQGRSVDLNGKELGPGTSLTKNGGTANSAASVPGGESGLVGRFEIPAETKLLDLEQSTYSDEAQALIQAIGKEFEINVDTVKDQPLDNFLQVVDDKLPPGALETVQKIAQSMGYEGFKFQDGAHLFNHEATPTETMRANPDAVPQSNEASRLEAYQQTTEPEKSQVYTPEQEQEIHTFRHGPPLNAGFTPEYMDPIVQETYDSARAKLDQWAKDDPALQKEINDTLGKEAAVDKQEKGVVEKLADCLSEEMS